jgi:hypothetical protein
VVTWPRTVWRVRGFPGEPDEVNIQLVLESTEPALVEAVEAGARANGIELIRVDVLEQAIYDKLMGD